MPDALLLERSESEFDDCLVGYYLHCPSVCIPLLFLAKWINRWCANVPARESGARSVFYPSWSQPRALVADMGSRKEDKKGLSENRSRQ